MLKRFQVCVILFILMKTLPIFSQENNEVQHLHYSISAGLGYQSFIYFLEHERAMESFLTFKMLATYYPLSFLSVSYHLGIGFLSLHNADDLSIDNLIHFPIKVNRLNIENTLALEFFGFITRSSLLYFSLGSAYVYMSRMDKQDNLAIPNYYPDSQQHLVYMKASFGSRFALFNNTIMDANMYIMMPFKKMASWINEGKKQYQQIVLGFEISIGYFN